MGDRLNHTCESGVELGSVIAVVLSWYKWHSIAWMILHGGFSWFYVIYYAYYYN